MTPIIFKWTGESMVPLKRFHNLLSQYKVGNFYRLDEVQERSRKTHAHYFATIRECWLNLPEIYAQEFPTPEHLRKWCLIKCGYHDSRSIVAESKAEAQRVAAFVRPMDDFAIVVVNEATVSIYTAKSQSMRAMGKAEFAQSKNDVLDQLAAMIDITTDELMGNTGKAA